MTTTNTWSEEQLDALWQAESEGQIPQGVPADEGARLLAQQGHELFRDLTLAPAPSRAATAVAAPAEVLDTVTVEPGGAATTHLPAKQSTALSTHHAGGMEGMEEMGADDFVIPSLKIKQEMTKDPHEIGVREIPNGHWFQDVDVDSAAPERKVIFLDLHPELVFMLPYRNGREAKLRELGLEPDEVPEQVQVICSSRDQQTPRQTEWGARSADCATCKHKKWVKTESGSNADCKKVYRGVAIDLGSDGQDFAPVRIQFGGTGVAPAKRMLTMLQVKGRGKRLPLFGLQVSLSSKETRNDRGDYYYVPDPKVLGPIDDLGMIDELRGMREQFVSHDYAPEEAE